MSSLNPFVYSLPFGHVRLRDLRVLNILQATIAVKSLWSLPYPIAPANGLRLYFRPTIFSNEKSDPHDKVQTYARLCTKNK